MSQLPNPSHSSSHWSGVLPGDLTVNQLTVNGGATIAGNQFTGVFNYSATTPTDWAASTPPSNVKSALDRIAAALNALGHKP